MARNKIFILTLVLSFLAFGFAQEANAQKSRNRVNPRKTKSTAKIKPPPPPIEPEVVSRAEDESNPDTTTGDTQNQTTGTPKQPGKTAARVSELSQQVTDLNGKITTMEKQNSLLNLERLSRAEERAETVRRQLNEAVEKEANLRAKIEQLDYQMQPEVIQLETATIGSTRPEVVRETRRKMLESEKTRTTDQLTKIVENRARLESAAVNADALADKLRAVIEAETETGAATTKTTTPKTGTETTTQPPPQ